MNWFTSQHKFFGTTALFVISTLLFWFYNFVEKPDQSLLVPSVIKPPTRYEWMRDHVFDSCPRVDSRVAIVMPFHNFESALKNVRRWHNVRFSPCSIPDLKNPPFVDLLFSCDSVASCPDLETLKNEVMNGLHKCFKKVTFQVENMPDKGHDQGSRMHFLTLVKQLNQSYDYFFLMEGDTHPVRENWANRVFMESICGEDFWIKGSHYRYTNAELVQNWGWHINGNALYNLRDQHLLKMLVEIANLGDPYDMVLGNYVQRSPHNALQLREIYHLYRLTEFVQNRFHYGPDQEWVASKIRTDFPYTYFVHGRIFKDD